MLLYRYLVRYLIRVIDRIPVGGEIFRTCPDWPWGPPSLLYNRYGVFPGGKERPGRDADTSHPSRAVVKKAIPLLPPISRTACTEPQCLYKGALYLLAFYTGDRLVARPIHKTTSTEETS